MHISVNNKPYELPAELSLAELLAHMEIPAKGTAIARNQQVVPQSQWPQSQLCEGDAIMIIRATAGG
ncbi:sulfur carrier protein ThiS [Parendozoicomonas haliclonae]|uniref:Sulfur carrier protein ThiS n=1 Tax=Parendozoicomonas haliclonae TaxID=1960125 RepID=A0A1X7AGF1_9GAMM|nr:sulfur carrier protein ThiS [Parendozoicomonas haliclonae]SMA38099.1 Sulfur carrier protein ThiS [Parendozoicomonas haliclonae]